MVVQLMACTGHPPRRVGWRCGATPRRRPTWSSWRCRAVRGCSAGSSGQTRRCRGSDAAAYPEPLIIQMLDHGPGVVGGGVGGHRADRPRADRAEPDRGRVRRWRSDRWIPTSTPGSRSWPTRCCHSRHALFYQTARGRPTYDHGPGPPVLGRDRRHPGPAQRGRPGRRHRLRRYRTATAHRGVRLAARRGTVRARRQAGPAD